MHKSSKIYTSFLFYRSKRRRSDPFLFNYNRLSENYRNRQDLNQYYDPTVPLPAYYSPPEASEHYDVMPPIEQPQLYPLIIFQAQQQQPQELLPRQELPAQINVGFRSSRYFPAQLNF